MMTLALQINLLYCVHGGIFDASFDMHDGSSFGLEFPLNKCDMKFEPSTKEEMLENAKSNCEDALSERLSKNPPLGDTQVLE